MSAFAAEPVLDAPYRPIPHRANQAGVQGRIHMEYLDGDSWDGVAAQFDDAAHEQSHCFNAARWGVESVENIAFYEGSRVIGGASVVLIRPPLLKTGIAIVKWGPLWRRRGEAVDSQKLASVLSLLRDEYAGRRDFYLTVMPPAHPGHAQSIIEGLEALDFSPGTALPAPARYYVDLTLDEDALRKSLSQKWRYNLKKSERHDFDIRFLDDMQGFDAFIGLYETMLERKKFDDTSAIRTLEKLMRSKSAAFRPRIVLLSHEGALTAGAVIDLSGDHGVYLYGATDDRALSLNAGYAIHWFIASFLRRQKGLLRYDLGGNDLDGGLHQFKKGFVGKGGCICDLPPSYHFGTTLKARAFGKAVFRLRDLKHAVSRKNNR